MDEITQRMISAGLEPAVQQSQAAPPAQVGCGIQVQIGEKVVPIEVGTFMLLDMLLVSLQKIERALVPPEEILVQPEEILIQPENE